MILFEKIENFQNDLNDASNDVRKNALLKLKKVGLPHRRVESWKYTNITEKLDKSFGLQASNDYKKDLPFDSEIIYFSNGKLICENELIDIKKIDLNQENSDLENTDALYLYNLASTTNFYSLSFKENPKKPVVLYHLYDESSEESSIATKMKLTIEKNQNIELVEVFETKASNFISLVQDIEVKENAKLFHNVLTLGNEENSLHLYTNTDIKRDAEYQNIKILLKNSLVRNEIKANLNESGAHAEIHGLYALNFNEHADTSSLIHHKAAHTTSAQLYKGIMANNSRGVFTGLVKIDKDAQQVNSNQLNKNLLLSKKSHANSRPQLEIFADDVKCSHGSTTGEISPEELFYFVSRGIKPMRARKLLSQAFAFDIILKIKNLEIQNYIKTIFTESYTGLEDINHD